MVDDLPDVLVLRPRRAKWLLVLVICVAASVIGAFMARDGEVMGYLALGLFGMFALAALATLWPNRTYLRLTRDGFEMRTIFSSWHTRWVDAGEFRASRISMNEMVVFDFAPGYVRAKRMRAVASGLAGAEGAIPDTYGYSTQELAAMLNAWRQRAMHAQS